MFYHRRVARERARVHFNYAILLRRVYSVLGENEGGSENEAKRVKEKERTSPSKRGGE